MKEIAENDIIRLAEIKLMCADSLPADDSTQRQAAELAALGVRLLLEFEPGSHSTAGNMENVLVERNMRLAYSVPAHRKYMRSGYSSELILAEAAANIMQKLRLMPLPSVYPRDVIANIVRKNVETGMIDKGGLGELTGRLLLTLALDRAQEVAQGATPRWSKPVGVIDFMKSLLGDDNYKKYIEDCVPDNETRETLPFKDYFKNSVVRFTHFVRAEDDITTRAACSAFVRGYAIQCHHEQKSVDVALPIHLNKDEPVAERNTSFLFSFKNRYRPLNIAETAIDADRLGCFREADPMDAPRRRSYISLVMEFGVESRVSQSSNNQTLGSARKHGGDVLEKPKKKSKTRPSDPHASFSTINSDWQGVRSSPRNRKARVHPRYLISIWGCSPSIYGVVHDKDVYARILCSRRIFTEHARSEKYIAAVQWMMPSVKTGADGDGLWFKECRNTTMMESVAVCITDEAIEVGQRPMESEEE
jgi:hypothetical protein